LIFVALQHIINKYNWNAIKLWRAIMKHTFEKFVSFIVVLNNVLHAAALARNGQYKKAKLTFINQ
jgi:hypothetical protein